MINYNYRTLVTYRPKGGGTIKEWLNSAFLINEGDYISLPSFDIRTKREVDVTCKIIKVWKVENIK